MKGICQNCEKETELEFIRDRETFEIRGVPIEVEVQYYKCSECEEEFEEHISGYDPLDEAYREYRRRQGMLQPEKIKQVRKKYGLTQGEMSKILGWGSATLSRYENGALQDEAHERMLRLVIEPRNLLCLIAETPDVLSEEKKSRLLKESYSFKLIYEERYGDYEENDLSGYRKQDLAKFLHAILFFCKEGVSKTKLNKLLFYADFKHFKEYAVPITGTRYAHIPFGPAPDKYSLYFAALIEDGDIRVEEIIYSEGVGEKFFSVYQPDLSLFSDSELKILAAVREHFESFTASKISEFSHQEKGYQETETGHIISYDYANQLKL